MDIRLRILVLALAFAGVPAAAAPPRATAKFADWDGPRIAFDEPMLT